MTPRDPANPRFSVLVPTHNQAGLLVLAVRSVLAQTFQDFEILLVADGCTDGTQDAIRSIGDSRIRLFDLPKGKGFGYENRNAALREARGELIAFLAHDDLYLPDHLERMNRVFHDAVVKWAYSRPVLVESDGSCHPSTQNLNVPTHLERLLNGGVPMPAASVVYRRACHDTAGYWDGSIPNAGDRDFWRRLIRDAGPGGIRFVPEATTLHFRAPWRENLRRPGPLTRDFKRPYPDAWPLEIDLAGNAVEQEVFLEAILADPEGWTFQFRRDLQAVLDGKLSAYEDERLIKRREKWQAKAKRRVGTLEGLRRKYFAWIGGKHRSR